MTLPLDEDDPNILYPPVPVLPELCVDLDLQVLTAVDDADRWSAVVAGTREVLARFDHLASPKVRVALGPTVVISQLRSCHRDLARSGHDVFAEWLGSVIAVLAAHQHLVTACAERVQREQPLAEAIVETTGAGIALGAAADSIAVHTFAPYPPVTAGEPDYQLMVGAGTCVATETHRIRLRTQLDGAGGLAGSAEFHPWVEGLYRLELATHRRLYRLFYGLCAHVGFDLADDPDSLFDSPDEVDRQEL